MYTFIIVICIRYVYNISIQYEYKGLRNTMKTQDLYDFFGTQKNMLNNLIPLLGVHKSTITNWNVIVPLKHAVVIAEEYPIKINLDDYRVRNITQLTRKYIK